MSATINDVAKEAGVSITTVSRVLNNNYPVKKETRIKIENAIKKLNYKPNAMARSLITKNFYSWYYSSRYYKFIFPNYS